ncbi:unnamed protein product [Spirodela intermedia]|uniref:Uncharacterized protein n=1 Tax=Spirodela intermedia TaxID=51605 RepID=A0A7I8J902_SPIIN|nr:unnamed protein product [Spirodela intermedia]CAA6666688.1 unnamed protein product [Spirodela intermedia]
MESSGGGGNRPRVEDVISKLKDDGDFDALRLKIVRKIKENEDLRSQIILEVKQSAALNREGAENLKPRQLSDAIHEEIGNKVMGHISDELWRIIRSSDGMRDEIRESVRSVYNKLMNPRQEETNGLPTLTSRQSVNDGEAISRQAGSSLSIVPPSKEPLEPPGFAPQAHGPYEAAISSDDEPTEPPGFFTTFIQAQAENSSKEEPEEPPAAGGQAPEHRKEELRSSPASSPASDGDGATPPGFAHLQRADHVAAPSDEDPDVPPGFG